MGGGGQVAELELGSFRPSASNLFFKDFVWTLSVIIAMVLWVQVIFIWPMVNDGSSEAADPGSALIFVAAADSVLTVGVVLWRYGRARALAGSGVVTRARVTKVSEVVGTHWIVYEFHLEGAAYTGRMGGGPLAERWELDPLVGKELVLLVDPKRPKVHLPLSKPGQGVRR